MKKIITIIAAICLISSSVFAVGFSATAKIDGSNLFSWSMTQANGKTATNTMTFFGLKKTNASYAAIFSFNGSVEKAGAKFSLWDTGYNSNTIGEFALWFQPFDPIKVTVGRFGTGLNRETVDWTNSAAGVDSTGLAVSFSGGSFSADVFYFPGWGAYWYKNVHSIGKTDSGVYVRAGLNSSVGNLLGEFKLEGNKTEFGVGYKNMFGSVTAWTNLLFQLDDETFTDLRSEWDIITSIGSVGIDLFTVVGWVENGLKPMGGLGPAAPELDNGVYVGCRLQVTMPLGPVSGYFYLNKGDIFAKKFAMDEYNDAIKFGVKGNVGIMSWDIACSVKFTVDAKFDLSVPATFIVNF